MSNLTGQYDVAAEIGLPLLSRIVAAIHANEDSRFPTFPHSISMFLDDTSRGAGDPVPASERTGVRSRVEVQVSAPSLGFPAPPDLSGGVLEVLGAIGGNATARSWSAGGGRGGAGRGRFGTDVVGDWGDWVIELPPTYPKVTARVRIRAWVRDSPEPGLPEFIDGELAVTVGLSRVDVPGGGTFLTLEREESLAVAFQPAAGTTVSGQERSLIERIVRNVIRSEAEPPTFEVALPPEVRHFNFRLQPSAPSPSVAAMFVLTDRPAPTTPAGVAQGFLPPGADLAVGIGGDYLAGLMRAQLLSGLPAEFSFSGAWGAVNGKVRPRWADATFALEPGRAVLAIPGSGSVTYGPAIGGATTDEFSFTARIGFGLAIVGGMLEPVAAGDPEIDFSGLVLEVGLVTDRARSQLKTSRDQALAQGRAEMRRALDVTKVFDGILGGILPNPPDVTLTSVSIRPEGVVVGAAVGPVAVGPPVVSHVNRDGMLDALQSWIPGGTIERFVWERRRFSNSGRVEEHRFVTEPLGGTIASTFSMSCLTLQGTRMGAAVSATSCSGLVVALPAWREPTPGTTRPLLPLTAVDANGAARVAGHYDPWGSGVTPSNGGTCLLVHFAKSGWADAEPALREAVGARKNEGALVVMCVVPGGSGAETGDELGGVPLIVTADDEGAWAKAYGGGTVLVGPRGDVVWRDEGAIEPAKLARVLDKHAEKGSAVSHQPLRSAVGSLDRAPEFPIRAPGGAELSLRRLRGTEVVLVFWSPRSEPSVRHVVDLGRMLSSSGDERPLVIAIADGDDGAALASADGGANLPFPVIPDPDRAIARRFGIWSWPATVVIGRDQRVAAVEFGGIQAGAGGGKGGGPRGD